MPDRTTPHRRIARALIVALMLAYLIAFWGWTIMQVVSAARGFL